jgi:hypothetical protein
MSTIKNKNRSKNRPTAATLGTGSHGGISLGAEEARVGWPILVLGWMDGDKCVVKPIINMLVYTN